jgi:Transglycosylase SLT domain
MLHRVAIVLLIAGCCFSSSATAEDAVSDLPAEQAPAALPTLDKRLICRTIEAAAVENDLPVDFFARLIWHESRFNNRAVSRAGARGIAQFMPGTASWRGLADPFDAIEALRESADYLRELRNQFGNLGLAAAAYNGGSGRVQNWLNGRGSLPSETRAYVRIITGYSAEDWASTKAPDWGAGSPEGIPCPTIANVLTSSSAGAPRARRQTQTTWVPWGVQLFLGNRSESRALADYAQLQRKYAGVLGGRAPQLLRIRMGGRGADIWTQIMLGFPSREGAEKLCSRLRSAGGSCLLHRYAKPREVT